jgi:hypothetical protein
MDRVREHRVIRRWRIVEKTKKQMRQLGTPEVKNDRTWRSKEVGQGRTLEPSLMIHLNVSTTNPRF